MITAIACSALVLCAPGGVSAPQETQVDLRRNGMHTKFLTQNLEDTWKFYARAGEVVVAAVETREFDPVLKLVGPEGEVLQEVDDLGSSSRFAQRLPADGDYSIQVHAFQRAGGGNYSLEVDRFASLPLPGEGPVDGRIGEDGRAHYHLEAAAGQVLLLRFEGRPVSWQMLDSRGLPLSDWEQTASIRRGGEHYLRLLGTKFTPLRFQVVEAGESILGLNEPERCEIAAQSADLWTFSAAPGDFRYVEIRSSSALATRLVPRDAAEVDPQHLGAPQCPMRLLPIASKGHRTRYAAVFSVAGRYQLQVRSHSRAATPYEVRLSDPAQPLALDASLEERIAIGDAGFYRFATGSGQLLRFDLCTDQFDGLLRVWNEKGEPVTTNDDGGGHLDARVQHLFRRGGRFLLQVSCQGDGGGGAYQLQSGVVPIPELELGARARGQVGDGAQDLRAFYGRAGQHVLVSVRSKALDPQAVLYTPRGIPLSEDDDGGVSTDSLLAAELPEDGRYVLAITARRGAGEYEVRLIGGD